MYERATGGMDCFVTTFLAMTTAGRYAPRNDEWILAMRDAGNAGGRLRYEGVPGLGDKPPPAACRCAVVPVAQPTRGSVMFLIGGTSRLRRLAAVRGACGAPDARYDDVPSFGDKPPPAACRCAVVPAAQPTRGSVMSPDWG